MSLGEQRKILGKIHNTKCRSRKEHVRENNQIVDSKWSRAEYLEIKMEWKISGQSCIFYLSNVRYHNSV